MPIAHADLVARSPSSDVPPRLPFPPVTKSHILNCSYHSWYPKYRSITPKARLTPLNHEFLSYLRADGIRLPPEDPSQNNSISNSSGSDSDDEEPPDPSITWRDIHAKIKSTIAELDGAVMPKLNWSAPKDATWIAATNSMECRTPNDIYLLLKSSDFITHDLEQVFHDCEDDDSSDTSETSSQSTSLEEEPPEDHDHELSKIPYHLILRKTVPNWNPALEFRCFVRSRHLLCICQRDLNYYSFLPPLIPKLRSAIQAFFNKNLQNTFSDENFVFDVYIPGPYKRVWLVDINPWAPRTDPLLFSWLEILNMRGREQSSSAIEEGVIRLSLNGNGILSNGLSPQTEDEPTSSSEEEDNIDQEQIFTPEFRLVNRDDPEAYSFNTPQYSAHKLPRDVVDASAEGEAVLREFMGTWREIVARQEREEREEGEDDG